MIEAVVTITKLAFEKLQAKLIIICCDATNDKSRKIPERLRYKLEANSTIFQRLYFDQQLVDYFLLIKSANNE
jgi:RimJ/RimL family protein N-acetyltransferase